MSTATKPKAKPAKATANTAPKEKAPRFEPNLVTAVKFARNELHGKRPGFPDGKRAPAASVGDHRAVRERITGMLDGNVTADRILKLTGLSLPRLEAVARFEPSSADDLKTMRDKLGDNFGKWDKNASWRTGRYAAGIIAAWVRELRVS